MSSARVLCVVLAVLLVAGCSKSSMLLHTPDGAVDARSRMDAGGRDTDSGLANRDAEAEPPPGAVWCAGMECGPGEECCYTSLRCFNPARPSDCPTPDRTDDPAACASNTDCPDGTYCSGWSCSGPGRCVEPSTGCTSHQGVCGCDGGTYLDDCEAQAAGVRAVHEGACGAVVKPAGTFGCDSPSACPEHHVGCDLVRGECIPEDPLISCGNDAECPVGQRCCYHTGTCMDAACADCCHPAPEGSSYPCVSDRDCARADGSYWEYPGSDPLSFCDGPDCTGPGGCLSRRVSCPGIVEPACGCDGVTYQNRCEAQRAAVRVDHDGEC